MTRFATTVLVAGLLAGFAPAAQAAIAVQPLGSGDGGLIQVYGGCGPLGHRGPWGGCRPGGQWGGYRYGRACPRGFHLGPYGRRCWPNHYF